MQRMESRRGLIKKTLGGAALLAAAGAVPLALRKTKLVQPRSALKFFTEAEYSIWAAVADRVLSQEVTAATRDAESGTADAALLALKRPAAPAPAQVDVAGKADAFLAPLSPSEAKDLKQLLALFDNALFSFVSGGPAPPLPPIGPPREDQQFSPGQPSPPPLQRAGL